MIFSLYSDLDKVKIIREQNNLQIDTTYTITFSDQEWSRVDPYVTLKALMISTSRFLTVTQSSLSDLMASHYYKNME